MLTFFFGMTINYALIIELSSYLGLTLFTIYQEAQAKWDEDADEAEKEATKAALISAAGGRL